MTRTATRIVTIAALVLLPAAEVIAQEDHSHVHGADETLGTVHFQTSCRPEVAGAFTRAVALLHSFGYEEARKEFENVARRDPSCGMASWGVAMTYYHPIWSPPNDAELAAGQTAARRAQQVGGTTPRERGYIAAIGEFYSDVNRAHHDARALAYCKALEEMAHRSPEDHEAAIFYALALLGTAPPSDTTYANQKAAAAILNGLLAAEPDHPGIAHYLIHAFDYPELAQEALPAARAYAKIAPSSPHALHMPTHIFTRLGLWDESIEGNLASAEAGRQLAAKSHPGAASFDTLHALDYLEYGYLQIDNQPRAQQVLEEAAHATDFDEPNFAAAYALSAIPARWALERRDWQAAAALTPSSAPLPWQQFPYASAVTSFAQALGFTRSGQPDRARPALDRLQQIQAALAETAVPGPYDWAGQVESMRRAAAAWLAHAEHRDSEAVELARSAASLEEKIGKHPVTPGAVLPARELLGDLLLEQGQSAAALVEYAASLRHAPNRFNTLYGAARAASLAGQTARAAEIYGRLVALASAEARRPELAEARAFLAKTAPTSRPPAGSREGAPKN
jgi:tetratricopeptide (TPR) repeat protein